MSPCGHAVHATCLEKIMSGDGQCPMCVPPPLFEVGHVVKLHGLTGMNGVKYNGCVGVVRSPLEGEHHVVQLRMLGEPLPLKVVPFNYRNSHQATLTAAVKPMKYDSTAF